MVAVTTTIATELRQKAPPPGFDLKVIALDGGSVAIDFAAEIDRCEDKTIVNRVQLTAGTTSETAFAASICKKSGKSKKSKK